MHCYTARLIIAAIIAMVLISVVSNYGVEHDFTAKTSMLVILATIALAAYDLYDTRRV